VPCRDERTLAYIGQAVGVARDGSRWLYKLLCSDMNGFTEIRDLGDRHVSSP